MDKITVYKETKENWYPSFSIRNNHMNNPEKEQKLVAVYFSQLYDKSLIVSVWGADDLGMEKVFPPSEREQAFELFLTIISRRSITYDFVESLGLIGA